MKNRQKNYIFHEYTYSLCPECMKTIPTKIVFEEDKVFLLKNCKVHGEMKHLLEDDKDFYLKHAKFEKPGTTCKTQSPVRLGCPYDCGLCNDHEQHTCIGLIDITNYCDLKCPLCYAHAGSGKFLEMEKIGEMMDFYQDSEYNSAEILQISGGEPTTHPKILEIIQMAKDKKFKYVMLNTHGLRFATDIEFVKEIAKFKGGFEVYIQFDGFDNKAYKTLRGKELLADKLKAIENLTKYKVPITLVCTVQKGVNENQIGEIISFGLNTKYIRGINFQPVTYFGRIRNVDPVNRSTLTGILKEIEKQTDSLIKKDDFIPLPCHVERVAFTYLYKQKNSFIPVTRDINVQKYLPIIDNTFTFYPERIIQKIKAGILDCNNGNCFTFLKDLSKLIPLNYSLKSQEQKFEHIDENIFRISVTSFIDAYNFDMKSMKKECVHFITPDLKKIPFSSYNMIYRTKYMKEYYL